MVFGLLLRGGVVAGAIHYTNRAGVWGSMDETDKLYNDVKSQLIPHVQEAVKHLPFELPQLPRVGEMRFLAKYYYNKGVQSTFHLIHMLPCYAGRGLKKVQDTFDDFAKSPAFTASEKQVGVTK